MSNGSDYWVPMPDSPYRILRLHPQDNPPGQDKQVWSQWGGRYRSVHHAAGYARACRPDTEPKRIVLVEQRCPTPRLGHENHRTVTIWEGTTVPDKLGYPSYCAGPDDIEFTE